MSTTHRCLNGHEFSPKDGQGKLPPCPVCGAAGCADEDMQNVPESARGLADLANRTMTRDWF